MSCSSICKATQVMSSRRLDAKGLRSHWTVLGFGLMAASMLFSFSGCQQLGFRSGEHDLLGNPESDDWSPPDSSGRVPRPSFANARGRSGASGYDPNEPVERIVLPKDRKKAAVQAKINEATAAPPIANDPAPAAPKTSVAADAPKIIDTPNQELDIDGALESLPPEYRSVLKQQLVAAKQKSATPAQSEMASAPVNASPVTTANATSVVPDSAPSGTAVATNGDTKKSGVSFKISEGNIVPGAASNEAPNTSLAGNHSPSSNAATSVASAPANAANAATSGVQQASFSAAANVANNNVGNAESPRPAVSDSGVQPASGFDVSHQSSSGSSNGLLNVPSLPSGATAVGVNPAAATPANWHQSLTQTIELLEKQIADAPPADENLRIHQEVTLRMLYVAQRRLEDSVRRIDFLADDEEDYFVHQMQALYEASNPDATPVRSRRWSLVMNSQREATNKLGAASNLEVRSAAFCTDVQGYGVISKFPKYTFTADQDVLLYCELENVAASEVKAGNETHFETQLQGSYQIIDADGKTIADQLLPMEPEVCKNHRRDYFMVYKIYMPQQIAAGNYKLKLTIEDLKGRKFGHASLDLQIKK